MAKTKKKTAKKKPNPAPKLRTLKKSTGWLKASAVRILKRGGRMEVLIRRGRAKRRR